MDFSSQNLTIPRGKMLFAEFIPETLAPGALRFMGNCPEFTLSQEATTVDHYSSTAGTRTMDASIPLGGDIGGSVVTDNPSAENLRYWLMGTRRTVAVTAQTAEVYNIADVKKGGYYQIGRTEANPIGITRLTEATVAASGGGAALTPFLDYEVDLETGLLHILPGGTVVEESDLVVTYATAAHSYDEVSAGHKSVEGEMRFVSDNPYGSNRVIIIPRARWAPQGDLSFLTDPESPAWMQISLDIKAMKKGNLPLVMTAEGLPYKGLATGTV